MIDRLALSKVKEFTRVQLQFARRMHAAVQTMDDILDRKPELYKPDLVEAVYNNDLQTIKNFNRRHS
jgi:hypothetical protein